MNRQKRSTSVVVALAVATVLPLWALGTSMPSFEYLFRDQVASSDLILIGTLEASEPFEETTRERQSELTVTSMLYSKILVEKSVMVNWRANSWESNGLRTGIPMDPRTQLNNFVGQEALWFLSIQEGQIKWRAHLVLSDKAKLERALAVLKCPPDREGYKFHSSSRSTIPFGPEVPEQKFKICLKFLEDYLGREKMK